MITAHTILELLRGKHSEDVFVPECKDGPTQSVSNFLRLDAWVMKRSWSHPITWGYEIKVSRNDFLRDAKWRGYLPLCSSFYFVCPTDLIHPEELPAEAGLMWVSKNGGRLFTKKLAPFRDIQIPETLYRYVLMSRVLVKDEYVAQSSAEFWRTWLKEKEDERELGHRVKGAIRDLANRLKCENHRLKEENESYAEVKKVLDELQIRSGWYAERAVRRQHADLLRLFPAGTIDQIKTLRDHLSGMLVTIERADAKPELENA